MVQSHVAVVVLVSWRSNIRIRSRILTRYLSRTRTSVFSVIIMVVFNCLLKDHNCYCQIRGQLGICTKPYFDFVCWMMRGMCTERIT